MSRRSFLTVGTLGVAGLSLADVMRLRASTGKSSAAPESSVIFDGRAGGPPHLDMYDMKPDSPEEYRRSFKPIKTNVPGLDVCEYMPLHTKCADRYTIIRSIAHTFNDHCGEFKRVMTGRIPNTPTETVNDSDDFGVVIVSEVSTREELLQERRSSGFARSTSHRAARRWSRPNFFPN